MSVKINRSGVSASIKGVEDKLESEVKDLLYGVAGALAYNSPVWSGAYVTSHSYVPKGSGGGRMRKSYREAGPVDESMMQDQGYQNLIADINSIDTIESGGGVFRNRSPHAKQVEFGPTPYSPTGYRVYATAADRYNNG